jgi:hypothetical protein
MHDSSVLAEHLLMLNGMSLRSSPLSVSGN